MEEVESTNDSITSTQSTNNSERVCSYFPFSHQTQKLLNLHDVDLHLATEFPRQAMGSSADQHAQSDTASCGQN